MTGKSKLIFQIVLGIFFLSFAFAACNSSTESKSTTDTTATKKDSTMAPMTDTSKKMTDTTSKMDTAKTRPVAPGN